MDDWLRLLGLVLIVEALLPFVSPRRYREMVARLSVMPDRNIRMVGLALLVAGVLLVRFS